MTRHLNRQTLYYVCNRLQNKFEVKKMNGFMDKLSQKIMPLANLLG